MTASVMAFLVTVSVLTTAAAWAAEEGLRRLGMATRWIWLGAMGTSALLLVGPILFPTAASGVLVRALGGAPMVELAPLVISPALSLIDWTGMSTALAVAWGSMSAGLLLSLLRTHHRLLRERSAWEVSSVHGRDVYVSVDRGPAVAGVFRPWIVLPRWALGLPEAQLSLVVLHEEEHVRAGDSRLLASALALVLVMPWNPVAWWQLRRLRAAMEVDCDRRVLGHQPDRTQYGNSLLTVAARASGASLGLAAFTERSLSLERRIIAMTPRRSRWTPVSAALFLLLAFVVGIQACGVESPVTSGEPEPANATEPSLSAVAAEPSAMPYTVAPSITNQRAVVQQMLDEYPPLLRDAGIGGTVRMQFFINEFGIVEDVRIGESSGHAALDAAAVAVASVYEFTPAYDGESPTPVWISFPITFQAR